MAIAPSITNTLSGGQYTITANSRHWANSGLMLGQRLRRWASVKQALVQPLVSAEFATLTKLYKYKLC